MKLKNIAKELNEDFDKMEGVRCGPFILSNYGDDERYLWLSQDSGEGMNIKKADVLKLLEKRWEEF